MSHHIGENVHIIGNQIDAPEFEVGLLVDYSIPDTWYLIPDTWYMVPDTWYLIQSNPTPSPNILSLFIIFPSPYFSVWIQTQLMSASSFDLRPEWCLRIRKYLSAFVSISVFRVCKYSMRHLHRPPLRLMLCRCPSGRHSQWYSRQLHIQGSKLGGRWMSGRPYHQASSSSCRHSCHSS